MMQDSTRIAVNRAIAAVAGGLAVLFVMFVAVVNPANARATELQKQLDTSAFGASRMLDEAKALLAGKHYREAGDTLAALDLKHPISPEAVEGRMLIVQAANSQAKDDAAWTLAVANLRGAWIAAETARLRAESEKELPATVERNWASAQDALRAAWESR
jgi:hypothetical protein